MKDLASPRPWTLQHQYSPEDAAMVETAYISGADNRTAAIAPYTVPESARRANARLIVRAVNAHDALVAALEAFLRAPSIESHGPGSSTIVVQAFNLWDARVALQAAKGEAPGVGQEACKGRYIHERECGPCALLRIDRGEENS